MRSLKNLIDFFKKETVLTVAWLAAIMSALFVPPSAEYLEYIDWRSLGILWSLMAIVQGLKSNYVFDKLGWVLLGRTRCLWQLNAVLVFLCFFSSMLITNDVALITFVPFAVMLLKKCHHEELMISVIILQTIAANLGSMLTPIGNPQNLYLYGISKLSIREFFGCMLPYTGMAGILLVISLFFLKGKMQPIVMMDLILQEKEPALRSNPSRNESNKELGKNVYRRILCYVLLFITALLSVVHIVPFYVLVISVFVVVLLIEKEILRKVDYTLLMTFVGFFIFTGNIGNISAVRDILQKFVGGAETKVGIAASQCISNVPAALLLSGFTADYKALLIGVNIGGLGTLIASMASLISYKIFANEYPSKKGAYFMQFTVMNVLFLIVLWMEEGIIH